MNSPAYENFIKNTVCKNLPEAEIARQQDVCQIVIQQLETYQHQLLFIDFANQQVGFTKAYYNSCTNRQLIAETRPVFNFLDHHRNLIQYDISQLPNWDLQANSSFNLEESLNLSSLTYAWAIKQAFLCSYNRFGCKRSKHHPPDLDNLKFIDLGPYRLLLTYSQLPDNCLEIDDLVALQTHLIEESEAPDAAFKTNKTLVVATIINLIYAFESYTGIAKQLKINKHDQALIDLCQAAAQTASLAVQKTAQNLQT